VVLSVGDGAEFTSAAEQVEVECAERGLPMIKLPYLGAHTGDDVIDAAFNQQKAEVLCSVVAEFITATDA